MCQQLQAFRAIDSFGNLHGTPLLFAARSVFILDLVFFVFTYGFLLTNRQYRAVFVPLYRFFYTRVLALFLLALPCVSATCWYRGCNDGYLFVSSNELRNPIKHFVDELLFDPRGPNRTSVIPSVPETTFSGATHWALELIDEEGA